MAGPSSADLDRMMRETQEAMRRLEAVPPKAKSADLDALIRDSDAKLEQIQRWKEGKHPLSFFQRLRRGFASHQGRWGDVLFAGVIFGLAVERLVEKKQTDALREELSEAKERAEDARAQLELATEEWREREGELATDVQRALNGSWWGLAKATRDALAAHQKRIDEAKAAVDQDGVVIGRALAAKDGAAEEAVEADAPLAEAQTPKPDAPAAEPVAAPAAVATKPPPPKKNVFMI